MEYPVERHGAGAHRLPKARPRRLKEADCHLSVNASVVMRPLRPQVRVSLGHPNRGVSDEMLYDAEGYASLNKMARERVPQDMPAMRRDARVATHRPESQERGLADEVAPAKHEHEWSLLVERGESAGEGLGHRVYREPVKAWRRTDFPSSARAGGKV